MSHYYLDGEVWRKVGSSAELASGLRAMGGAPEVRDLRRGLFPPGYFWDWGWFVSREDGKQDWAHCFEWHKGRLCLASAACTTVHTRQAHGSLWFGGSPRQRPPPLWGHTKVWRGDTRTFDVGDRLEDDPLHRFVFWGWRDVLDKP